MLRTRKGNHLTRREEQIMEILFRLGEAAVADFERLLPGSPTPGAVRRMLNILTGKGMIEHRMAGPRKIYRAAIGKDEAGTRALRHVMETFFSGSAVSTVGALFSDSALSLSSEEKKQLAELIENARKRGR